MASFDHSASIRASPEMVWRSIAKAGGHQGDSLPLLLRSLIVRYWEILDTLSDIADLLVAQDRKEQAVELAAFLLHHLAGPTQYIQGRTSGLLTTLESDLLPDIFAAAFERGRELKLETVVVEFLNAAEIAMTQREAANNLLVEPLTERELEILGLIAAGLSNHEIADNLVVTVATVKKHINNLYSKLGVTSRTRAIVEAQRLNLL